MPKGRDCGACNRHIFVTECLQCIGCRKFFHHDCVNISKEYFVGERDKLDLTWQCPECMLTKNKRRTRNDDTPIRPEPQHCFHSSPDTGGITYRKKQQVNVCLENSFEIFTDTIRDEDESASNPDIHIIQILQNKIAYLEEKLQAACKKNEYLILKNKEYEKNINQYKRNTTVVDTTPTKNTESPRKNSDTNTTFSITGQHDTGPTTVPGIQQQESLCRAIPDNNLTTNCDRSDNRCDAGQVQETQTCNDTEDGKHKVLLIADETGRDLRKLLKNRLGNEYQVTAILKPYASLDCLHLQLYREPAHRLKGQAKASLSFQQFLGFESGFTLDKESHTIAVICQDVTVVLAFETREKLIAWQVKVAHQLGPSQQFVVLVGSSRRLQAGPARLHVRQGRVALTSGLPPRIQQVWELHQLRRYGVVEGRFCLEGGSQCGKGEGLHLLISDQAQNISDAFDDAVRGNLTVQRSGTAASRKSAGAEMSNKMRPATRLSDFNTVDQSIPDSASGLYEENFFGEDCGGVSPYWPSDERRFDDSDFRKSDVDIGSKPLWNDADQITLERCNNCLSKLGGMTRSSTVALSPTSQFNPAWTMEAVPESNSDSSSNNTEYLTPRMIRKTLACQCKDKPPQRPPKPGHLEQRKPPAPLPSQKCTCSTDDTYAANPKVGPYENYDFPKTTPIEKVDNGEYYDTPKRIKQAFAEDLFQVTKTPTPGALVLKKNCGCVLKFASKKKPVIVECEENLQPVECPCQKVTNWANNLISLPYCKKEATGDKVNTEILTSKKSEEMAIYATVDVTRKSNRQSSTVSEKDNISEIKDTAYTNYQNLEPGIQQEFEGPLSNYENLEFALSLEYYENAKDLLKKAGVTQSELDALSANLDKVGQVRPKKPRACTKCDHSQAQKQQEPRKTKADEYLVMDPSRDVKSEQCRTIGQNPGYTPMSPNPNWSQSLKHPLHKLHKVEIEKALSIPTLNGSSSQTPKFGTTSDSRETIQKRSNSVDSARLLEDLKEFDSSIGSHGTSSSLETLRNMAIENRCSSRCENDKECYDCCKSSGSENKTSEESSSKDVPHLRNKHIDNAQIKRSSSVPCKGGNRDSSSSNDSGVSSCSMKHGGEFHEFEMPLTSGQSRNHYMASRRMRGKLSGCLHSSLPRKSKSSDPLRDQTMSLYKSHVPAKSSSAEAEVPVLPPKQFKGVPESRSTSSGTSDLSDYIETLSITSSHSSSDSPHTTRFNRQPTSTLRPRSGKEYHNLDPILTSMYKSGKDLANYTNLP